MKKFIPIFLFLVFVVSCNTDLHYEHINNPEPEKNIQNMEIKQVM